MAAKCQILIYCNLFVIALFQQVCYYYIKEKCAIVKKGNGIVKKCAVREYPKSWIGDIRQRDERAALKSLVPQVGDRLH